MEGKRRRLERDVSLTPDHNSPPQDSEELMVGIIEKVSLRNFLCHSCFTCNLGKHVNFVIGRNGSGKSAILTAVVVALGGKTSVTNRGTSIKTLIQTGKRDAEVAVTLRNRGADAYKPDVYGESITVERRITSDGNSQYKLRNKLNKVVSNRREELDRILDQFNIQVDNPVSVLNQDTSRNFLFSKSAHDKYQFFLKATQLDQMEKDYLSADESRQVSREIMERKEQDLPRLEAEVAEWEQKVRAFRSIDDLRQKVKALRQELAWAIVNEKEKDVEKNEKLVKREQVVQQKLNEKVQECENKVGRCKTRMTDIQRHIQEICVQAEQLEPQHHAARASHDTTKKALRHAQSQHDKLDRELEMNVSDLKQLEARIKDLRSNAAQNNEAERQAREKQIEELEKREKELSAAIKTTEFSLQQFHNAVTKLKNDTYRLKSEETNVRRNMEAAARRIKELEASRKDNLKRFGAHMPQLIKAINEAAQAGRFHQRPRGPVGANLKLLDSSLGLAVENCVSGLLHAFCVTDHHDERELDKILTECLPRGQKRPVIITSTFSRAVYDVSSARSRLKYPTVLDTLKIDDPVIANCLIDQRGVESVILIKDLEEAYRVMKSNPSQVNEAYTQAGDQIYCRPTFRHYSSRTNRANFLTSSLEDDIRVSQEDLARLKADHKQAQSKVAQADKESKQNLQEHRKCETQLSKLRSQMSNVKVELDELRSIEDPDPVDVATLEEEVERYQGMIKELEEKLVLSRDAVEQAKTSKVTAEKAFLQLEQQKKRIADKIDPLKEELAHAENEIGLAEEEKSHKVQKQKEHKKKCDVMVKELNAAQDKLKADIAETTSVYERVNTRRTRDDIQTQMKLFNKRIQQEEELRGNEREITEKYREKLQTFNKVKLEVKQILNFLTGLDNVMKNRQHRYFEFRRIIALRTRYFFVVLLNNRNYCGQISFSHDKRSLELEVKTSSTQKEAAKDLRALSGGERSFATVCFILSLWDTMESPFRFLDEFDVFMDMVNRRVSMDMMMEVAQNKKYNQFIFLTPQNMSHMKTCNNVRILEISKPERGQTALPYRRDDEEEQEM